MEIVIEGVIGWDYNPSDIREKLKEANGDNLEIQISSPGGSAYDGNTIYDLLISYKKKYPNSQIIITSFGISASMASIISLAGDIHKVYENTTYIIHNTWCIEIGDKNQMRKTADILDRLDSMAAKVYKNKSGKSLKEIKSIMDEETFFYGQEIVDNGFADEIIKINDESTKEEKLAFAKIAISETIEKMKNTKDYDFYSDCFKAVALIKPESKVNTYKSNAKLIDETWSASESETRWRDHAGVKSSDDLPNSIYTKRFSWYDENDMERFDPGYKFPIWDYKSYQGGEFVNISAVKNGLARLSQSDITQDDQDKVRVVLEKYLERYKNENEENDRIDSYLNKKFKTEVRDNMTPEELKQKYPELYNQIMQIGKDEEYERSKSHIVMGRAAGNIEMAVKNIEEKKDFSISVNAEYQAEGMRNGAIQKRKEDDIDTGSSTGSDDEADTKQYTEKLKEYRGVK